MIDSALRQRLDTYRKDPQYLLRVLKQMGHTLEPNGREFVDAKHDSFTVFRGGDGKWRYKWFSRDEHGDVFDALHKLRPDVTNIEAQIDLLEGRIALPKIELPTQPVLPEVKVPFEPLDRVADRAHRALLGNDEAMRYLTEQRGVWPEMIDECKLGLYNWYQKWSGLYHRAISIPIYPAGSDQPTAIRLRLIGQATRQNGKPLRYVSIFGSQSEAAPFTLRHHDSPHTTVVVGGEFKAISVMQHLVERLVGDAMDYQLISPAGESIWNMEWLHWIITPRVILIPDPDRGGDSFRNKVLRVVRRTQTIEVPASYVMQDGSRAKPDDAIQQGWDLASLVKEA